MMKALALLCAALLVATPALAQTKISGTLVATKACPALQSIKKATNPGDVSLTVGNSYKIIASNKPQATHYWIVVPGAPDPDYRWVTVDCGTAKLDGGGATTANATPVPAPRPATPVAAAGGKAEYVLAISWEPAFCEGLSTKAECKAQTASSFEATHLVLHGLWPQPRSKAYCGVSTADKASDDAHNWAALPAVDLSPATRRDLYRAMPGTQSVLERHEWIVHGTCSGASQDAYFSREIVFLDAIDNSAVGTLFAQNVGKRLDNGTVRAAFDTAFGKGAGERVRLACEQDGDRRIISEITIGLRGDVMGSGGIGELIAASSPTSAGCTGGIVDPVGLQ
jgi:ribonuclease T2